jgi:aldose sugar dehydrogenase
MSRSFLLILIAFIGLGLAGVAFATQYLGWGSQRASVMQFSDSSQTFVPAPNGAVPPTVEMANTQGSPKPTTAVSFEAVSVVEGLSIPWSLAFTSQERLLFTERPGNVRAVLNGQLQPKPLFVFPETSHQGEEGVMGMTLHPKYATNKWVYVAVAYPKNNKTVVKLVKFVDSGETWANGQVILDDIPAARNHSGTRLRFGPDGKLYVTTGDASQKELAQNMQSLAGKILRLNDDGSRPSDNPFPGTLIYSYGHRNPQGLDWHPVTKNLYATEHGPSTFDGPPGGDEVNFIQAGKNYGWPLVSHDKTAPNTEAPLLVYTPATAPASGMFYKGSVYPQFTNSFFYGGLRGEGLYRVVFDQTDPKKAVTQEKVAGVNVGRVRDIVEGPDGLIYFTTSNTDGRGKPRAGDDHIYRLVPR